MPDSPDNPDSSTPPQHPDLSFRMDAIGRLAGGVAHDFKNYLTVISGYARILRDGLEEVDPRREAVQEILHASEGAAALTRQLLAMSGRQVVRPERFDLGALILELRGTLEDLLGEDVVLEVDLADDLPYVVADPRQLEQVILNLAINAREAMSSHGHLTLDVGVVTLDAPVAKALGDLAPGSYVRFSMSDDGGGMSPDIRDMAFEPFFSTREEASGLGLSTVYGVVRQSRGVVTLDSTLGDGCEVCVYLPAAFREGATQQTSGMTGAQETILVVEDDAAVGRVVRAMLTKAGFRVFLAAGGPEALQICQEIGPVINLVLTDVVMPDMGGVEVVRRIQEAVPGIDVLYMSGYTEHAIHPHGVAGLGAEFIEKPFDQAHLVAMVRKVLDS